MKEYNKSRPPENWDTWLVKRHEYKPETLQTLEVVYDNVIGELVENKEE